MLYFLVTIIIVIAFFQIIGIVISGPAYKGPATDHFDGKRFINPGGIKAKGLIDVWKWMLNRKRIPWKIVVEYNFGPKPEPSVDSIRITFINHSTFLIQVSGVNILTDPVWSKRTSPFSWTGPKRMREPGIRFEDLPKIDFVILSHNHYDHFDVPTIRMIHKFHNPQFITPLGLNNHLIKEGISTGKDMDWWDEQRMSDSISIQSVPAQHFSGRGFSDRDKTLWCGYVLKTSGGKIYFAGDTGYNPTTFLEIGEKSGPFALSIIPIGAYKPSWFMSPIHCSPKEAVLIHSEVKSDLTIGSHFGTFPLADDSQDDPVNDLKEALKEYEIPENKFFILKEGLPFDLK